MVGGSKKCTKLIAPGDGTTYSRMNGIKKTEEDTESQLHEQGVLKSAESCSQRLYSLENVLQISDPGALVFSQWLPHTSMVCAGNCARSTGKMIFPKRR